MQEPLAIGTGQQLMQSQQFMGGTQQVMTGTQVFGAVGTRTSFNSGVAAAPVATLTGPVQNLHVVVGGATGLRDADFIPGAGKSDPYAVVELEGKRRSRFAT